MAPDNASWGYLRISGDLKKVGRIVARTAIAKTMKDKGIAPSPNRPTSRKTFLKSHADVIAAADFFTVEVWTKRGLVTHRAFRDPPCNASRPHRKRHATPEHRSK
jgi:hypothetical protein